MAFSGNAADMLKQYGKAVPEQQPLTGLEESRKAKRKLEADKCAEEGCTEDHEHGHGHAEKGAPIPRASSGPDSRRSRAGKTEGDHVHGPDCGHADGQDHGHGHKKADGHEDGHGKGGCDQDHGHGHDHEKKKSDSCDHESHGHEGHGEGCGESHGHEGHHEELREVN